jgi:DNA polymerase III alpha subunit
MLNFVSPHVHQASFDSGSTPKTFLDRELELGTGALVTTDHGTLQAAREVFDLAKENGLNPIIGLEAFFRDDDCPLLKKGGYIKGTRYRSVKDGSVKDAEKWEKLSDKDKLGYVPETGFFNYFKYAHLTMHFMDAEAYETGVRLLSAADARAEKHGSERKPLFGWKELEELGSKNVTFGSGCLIGMVQRHMLGSGKGFTAGNNAQMALWYYQRLRSIVKPGNFLVEAFPHVCDRNWESKVVIDYQDGTSETFPDWKKVKTNEGELKAEALAEVFNTKGSKHETLFEVMENRAWVVREGKVMKVVRHDQGYVQNECRPWCPSGDVQKDCNRLVMDLAAMHGDPVMVSDDSHYARPDEKVVQNVRLNSNGSWRFYGSHHRQSSEESFAYFRDVMGIPEATFQSWVENSHAWAARFKDFSFNTRLSLPTKFYPGDNFERAMSLIAKHGRMNWGDKGYVDRLGSELQLLHKNGTVDLLPYFFVAEEVCDFFTKKGLLTGPGRGSAAGMLFSYLLSITHVDPLKYGLSQERFLTLDRIKGGKLPDIDQDLQKHQRHLLIDPESGWLKSRFPDHYSQISVDTKLSLRNSVKDVSRFTAKDGRVPAAVEALTKKFAKAPQGIEDYDFVYGYEDADGKRQPGSLEWDEPLMEYARKYPHEWSIVDRCLGMARNKGRHPCAFVITNEPIANFIPMMRVSDIQVTQYTAKSVEAVGGLKMDYLGVNSLDDIANCIKLIRESVSDPKCEHCPSGFCSAHIFNGELHDYYIDGKPVPWFRIVPFKGNFYDIWDLPQDQAVFRDICEGRTETVFQFNTSSAKKWFKEFNHVRFVDADGEVHKALDTDEALAAFTALDRPGPLDYYVGRDANGEGGHNMLVEYARRASGLKPTGNMPILDKLLPETLGIIVYQEQLQRIFQTVGQTTPAQADAFRVHISKKQMEKVYKDKALFMPGAIKAMSEQDASNLWDSMETFGKYGFNKSHAVCYASKTGYACAWLKHHYPLQWWTAVLRNADKNEVSEDFWPYCGKLVLMPDVVKSGPHFQVEGDHIRAPISLLAGIGEKAHEQLLAGFPYKDIDDLCQKIQERKKTARSALHRGVIYTLIQGGAMDSLFPEGEPVFNQLTLFEIALAKATGKKLVKVDMKKFADVSQLVRYQMRKAVLPIYSTDLIPVIVDMRVQGVSIEPHKDAFGVATPHAYTHIRRSDARGQVYDQKVVLVDGPTYGLLRKEDGAEKGELVAVVGYVKSARKFSYAGGDQGSKQALEVVIDVGGFDYKLVRWPGRDGRLASKYTEQSLIGGIVIAVATKYDAKKDFVVEDLRVIQEPFSLKSEESPADEKEKNNGQEALAHTRLAATAG